MLQKLKTLTQLIGLIGFILLAGQSLWSLLNGDPAWAARPNAQTTIAKPLV